MRLPVSGFVFAFFGVFLVFGSSVSAYTKSDILSNEIKVIKECTDQLNLSTCTDIEKVLILYKTKELAPTETISENTEKTGNIYKIYSGQPYYKDTDGIFKKTEYDLKSPTDYLKLTQKSWLDLVWLKIKRAYALTFAPQAGDGEVHQQNAVWATLKSATSGAEGYTGTTAYILADYAGTPMYRIYRGFFPFDTSSIYDTDIIGSVKLYIASESTRTTGNVCDLTIIKTNQAGANSLVANDFDNVILSTRYSNFVEPAVSAGSFVEFIFTNTSIISATSTSWIGVIPRKDFENVAPVGATGKDANFYFRTSEYVGTSYDPYLLITTSSSTPAQGTTTSATTTDLTGDMVFSMAMIGFLLCFIFLGLVFNAFMK